MMAIQHLSLVARRQGAPVCAALPRHSRMLQPSGISKTSLAVVSQSNGKCIKRLVATRATSSDDAPIVPTVAPKIWLYFMSANLAVYAAGICIALTVDNDASNDFFMLLAKVDQDVAAGEWWRLLTANFMHAGVLHLVLNNIALYMLAPQAEAALGYFSFAVIYLLSGVSGSVVSFLSDDLVTVGASGSIFGLLGALMSYFVRNPTLERRTQQLLTIVGILGVNVILGLDQDGLIDNTGHIGGLAAGIGLGWAMTPVFAIVSSPAEAPVLGMATASQVETSGSAQNTEEASAPEISDDSGEDGTTSRLIGRLGAMVKEEEPEIVPDEVKPPVVNESPKIISAVIDRTSDGNRYRATIALTVLLLGATWYGVQVKAEQIVPQIQDLL